MTIQWYTMYVILCMAIIDSIMISQNVLINSPYQSPADMYFGGITPPKTNISPEQLRLEDYFPFENGPFSGNFG